MVPNPETLLAVPKPGAVVEAPKGGAELLPNAGTADELPNVEFLSTALNPELAVPKLGVVVTPKPLG